MFPTTPLRWSALAAASIALLGAGALSAPAATASTQDAPLLVAPSFDIASNGAISALLSIAGLPQGAHPSVSWSVQRTELIQGACGAIDWSAAQTVSEGSREDVSNGINTLPIPHVSSNGCYSLDLVLHSTILTPEVRVSAGDISTTVAVRDFTERAPRGFLGETRLVTRDITPGMLQETNEIYFAHPSARNVAITPHLIDHTVWRIVEVSDGEFRLINKATGNALQATREPSTAGNHVVTTPASWDNQYQRWTVEELWRGTEQVVVFINVGTGTALQPSGTPYLHGDTFGVEVGAGGGWTVTNPIDFDLN